MTDVGQELIFKLFYLDLSAELNITRNLTSQQSKTSRNARSREAVLEILAADFPNNQLQFQLQEILLVKIPRGEVVDFL